ncbi:hypothetical protein PQR52_25150 [Paraburkholderia aspalathi]|uniref:hypothetical protein n=1 Tax=Paraburkholderia aspalathi TaxID=1324617 RepID=UPI0038BAA9FB
MTLFSLGFAVCELRKALIYKMIARAGKTPKAGVAGSIPAGRTNLGRYELMACLHQIWISPHKIPFQGAPVLSLNVPLHPLLSHRFDRADHLALSCRRQAPFPFEESRHDRAGLEWCI